MTRGDFFAQKEQAEFIQRVYKETPALINRFFQQELDLLRNAVGKSRKILEVGCGFGRAVSAIEADVLYSGIDIGYTYVLEAKHRNQRGNWICGDATKLPFGDQRFDCVFCIQNTLGNMEGIETQVVAECKRVCAKNGRVIFSVYSEDSFEVRRLWYDRLIDVSIFGRVWLDQKNPRIARSDTGWSSRCFDREEFQQLIGLSEPEITKLDSFLYFYSANVR
jgi:SAM-dependent methyltransferase